MSVKHQILFVICLLLALTASAQELTVKGMQATNDISASQHKRMDNNNEPCGLVKVRLATMGAQFEGNVIPPVEYKTGEYWVYMSKGSRELHIKHPSFLPVEVHFGNYGLNKGIQSLTTYTLTLAMPQGPVVVDDGLRYLVMSVEPTNAMVYIDDQLQQIQNGTLSLLLSQGSHNYRVEAPTYEAKNGTFTIGNEKLSLPVKLESTLATLKISATTTGTQIYVNDQLRGTSSWTGSLAAGTYRVEGRMDGYRNHRQNVTLEQRDNQQITIPALQAIIGILNVNYQPANAEVWIDGKKVGSSPDVFRNIIVGRHEVEIRANGYATKKEIVTVAEGQTATLTGSLSSQNVKQTQTATNSTNISTSNNSPKEDFVPNEKNLPGQEYPMVNSEGYARFRVEAPDAKSVTVSLGLGGSGGTVLSKDRNGVWTGTTEGPMDEGFHYYHLTIDGTIVNDPGTQTYFGSSRIENGIEIPASDKDFYAYRENIAHGNVQQVQFYSKSLGKMQTAMVYLPPTYGKKDKQERFPVLYLQHGWGENETSWYKVGHIDRMMDNLIADGKIKPFIVVMAYGLTNDIKFSSVSQFTAKEFETVLIDELIPHIDANFLTKADKWNRAMAGLSMGGMETKLITLRCPEVFGYWGLLSGGVYMPEDIKDPKQVRMIFESCGSKENPQSINKSVNALKAAGMNAHGYISPGTAHEFLTWRRSFREMAPLLFK